MELGRYNAACPYNVTTLGAAAGNDPNTVTASSGFATGTNTYVLANQNSLVLAAPMVTTTVAASAITDISATSGGQGITGNSSIPWASYGRFHLPHRPLEAETMPVVPTKAHQAPTSAAT